MREHSGDMLLLLSTSHAQVPVLPLSFDRLIRLVVKASAWRAEDPWFESYLRQDFSGVESYQ